ncbi:MAG: cell division protein FtsH [Thermoleophilia bacterium]|nr:cell division protein FtsH [Thermoleophilia bacterium]MCZ4495947.1 cell division protein FtsH [Thermoleophilia bacterium]
MSNKNHQQPQPNKPEQPRTNRNFIIIALVCIAAFSMAAAMASSSNGSAPKEVRLSEFTKQVESGKIENARVLPQQNRVIARTSDGKEVTTTYSPDFKVTEKLEAADVPFDVNNGSKSSGASWLILLGLVGVVVLVIVLNRNRNQAAKQAAGAPGKMMEVGEVTVTFKDVAGCDEVVAELDEIRGFLENPEKFRKLGASIPKGVMLYGPPGTGKTLLARAVAGEAGVPFFSISGSDFVEMYVGVGASRVRKLFEAAKANAPCVIFIDEIDAVGRKRSNNAQGGQEERENTLNQLLVEMDGFSPSDAVIVMGASNRSDILDPALTRPGRFDRSVVVDTPDRKGRFEILKVHGKGKPFAADVDLEIIARQTAGFSGADLANLVNEAALLTARGERDEVTNGDLDEAIMRVLAGPQKTRLLKDSEKKMIAAHEIGHAIVANQMPEVDPVHKVTIVSRGRALGLMVSLSEDDRVTRSRTELMQQMAVCLGGRVAEELVFGEIWTGAENDLEKVNAIAQRMVLQWGMSDNFSLRALVSQDQLMAHSDELKGRIDVEIDAIVGEAKLMAQEVLLEHREALERLTTVLIERETLERDEFELLMRGGELPELIIEADGTAHATQQTTPVRLAHLAAFTRPGIGHEGSSTEDAGWAIGDLDRRDAKSSGAKFRFGAAPITQGDAATTDSTDSTDANDTDTTQEVA